jgi:hypothetical protein
MSLIRDTYSLAATLYIARELDGAEECFRKGCDRQPIVAFTFLSEDEQGEVEMAYNYLCRTHMHGWLGEFLDNGSSYEVEL